jgi:hypothetical protein
MPVMFLPMNFKDSRRFEPVGLALTVDAPILAHEDTGHENAAGTHAVGYSIKIRNNRRNLS